MLLDQEHGQANLNAIVTHQDPSDFAEALTILLKADLLSKEDGHANRNLLIGHKKPKAVAEALIELYKAGLLEGDDAQANRDAIVGHQNPIWREGPNVIALSLIRLHEENLLTSDNRSAVLKHDYPYSVPDALIALDKAGLLTNKNRQAIMCTPDAGNVFNRPMRIASAIIKRHEESLSTHTKAHQNRDAFFKAPTIKKPTEATAQNNVDATTVCSV